MAKARLRLVAPATAKRTVATPTRRPNSELRPREHLTEREVEKLIDAAKGNRHGATRQCHDADLLPARPARQRCASCSGATWSSKPARCTCAAPRAGNRHPSVAGRRTTGAAGAETRGQVALHLRQRAGCALHRVWPAEDGRACRDRGQDALQGPPAHAAPCHGLRAGQQGHRHADAAGAIWAIARSRPRCATPNWRRADSRTCGGNNLSAAD